MAAVFTSSRSGKAAAAMAAAFVATPHLAIRQAIAIGTHAHADLPSSVEWIESSHPFPDSRSEVAGNRAIAIAQQVHSGEALVILLSGGASALMAAPVDGPLARGQDRYDADDDGGRRGYSRPEHRATSSVERERRAAGGGVASAPRSPSRSRMSLATTCTRLGRAPAFRTTTTWADARQRARRLRRRVAFRSRPRVVRAGSRVRCPTRRSPVIRRCREPGAQVIGSRGDAMEGARRGGR